MDDSEPTGATTGDDASEKQGQTRVSAADLFGDDSDDDAAKANDSDAHAESPARGTAPTSQGRAHSAKDLFGSDEEDEDDLEGGEGAVGESQRERDASEPKGEEVVIEHTLKRLPTLGSQLYYMRLPNFLSIATGPKAAFDPQTYSEEYSTETVLSKDGQERLKLKVENTIRHRVVKGADGVERIESNARFVRWSDNSLTFHLGREVFEVLEKDIAAENLQLYSLQQVVPPAGEDAPAEAESMHVAYGLLPTKLTFRPISMASDTHKKLTLALADRFIKTAKVKKFTETMDPRAYQEKKAKEFDDLLKNREQSANRRQKVTDDTEQRLDADFLEDAPRRKSGRGRRDEDSDELLDSDEEEEEEDYSNFRQKARDDEAESRKLTEAKKASEPEGRGGSAKRRRGAATSDSEEEESDGAKGARGKQKRRRAISSDEDD